MKKIEDFFADYLDGKVSEKQLKSFFEEHPGSEQEFEELKQLFEELPAAENVEVSQKTDDAFYSFLNEQKAMKKPVFAISFKEVFKYAAMFLAVGAAYYFGTKKQVETIVTVEKPVYITQTIRDTVKVKEEAGATEKSAVHVKSKTQQPQVLQQLADLKKEMTQINEVQHKMILAMLRQESAASRLQAINYSFDLEVANGNLMNALFETLEGDPSINVRLAALEAVGRFELSPSMRENLVLTLAEQRDPSLQMALINKLIELREVKALPVFAGILNNPKSSDLIRNQAEYGMKILNM
jgi:hypothetical protein